MTTPRELDELSWFAGQALGGILAAQSHNVSGAGLEARAVDFARVAWALAQAMVSGRPTEGPGTGAPPVREAPGRTSP